MKFNSSLSDKPFTTVRRLNRTLFYVVFGVIILALGILVGVMMSGSKDYVEVEATIVEITADNEVYVEYQVDRIIYKEKTNSYSSSYRVGQTLTVNYNPENPSEVVDNPTWFPFVIIAIGLIAIVYGVYTYIQERREEEACKAIASGEVLPDEDYERYVSSVLVSDILPGFVPDISEDQEENEYYFHFCGKMGQGHILETPDRTPIYEAVLTRFRLLSSCDYDFVDCRTGRATSHQIGKTVTETTNSFTTNSGFKLDGVNIFDIWNSSAYSVETELGKLMASASYTIYYKGERVGAISTAGTDIMPNVKSNKLTKNLHSQGLYRVYCSDRNVPVMFLYALTLARTDYFVYE